MVMSTFLMPSESHAFHSSSTFTLCVNEKFSSGAQWSSYLSGLCIYLSGMVVQYFQSQMLSNCSINCRFWHISPMWIIIFGRISLIDELVHFTLNFFPASQSAGYHLGTPNWGFQDGFLFYFYFFLTLLQRHPPHIGCLMIGVSWRKDVMLHTCVVLGHLILYAHILLRALCTAYEWQLVFICVLTVN